MNTPPPPRHSVGATIVTLFALSCTGPAVVDDDVGVEVPPPPDLPVLQITSPERGAWVANPVVVEGVGVAGTGALTSLEIDDVPVRLEADGSFRHVVEAPPGLLILGSRLEDDLGERAVDGRTVMVGPVNEPDTVIPRAVGMQLGPELLDDDDPDVDDLASVSEILIEDPAFSEPFVGMVLEDDLYDTTITGLTLGSADVDLTPRRGTLELHSRLSSVESTFDADIIGWFVVSGVATMDVVLDLDLAVTGVDGGGVAVEAVAATATVENFVWEVEWVPEFVEDLLREDVIATLEAKLAAESAEVVSALFQATLESFARDVTFGEGDAYLLTLDLVDGEVDTPGLVVWLDARVQARHPQMQTPPGAGPPATPGDAPTLPRTTDHPLLVVIDDDVANEALYAVWEDGALADVRYSGADLLALTGGEDLPPPLGPVSEASLTATLPPVLTPPSTDEAHVDVAVGELLLSLVRDDGEEITASLNLRAPSTLDLDPTELSAQVDTRPANLDIQVGMLAWPEGLDPGDLASLFRMAAPGLLSSSDELMPAFPVPTIPVGEMFDTPELAGVEWSIDDMELSTTESGWMELTGRVVQP